VKKLVVVQPGKLGDILITVPMAKYYYDQGYTEIHWPVFDNFISILERFEYIKPISFGVSLDKNTYLSKKRVSFYDPLNTAGARSIEFFDSFYKAYPDTSDFEVLDACFAFPGHRNEKNPQIAETYMKAEKSWLQLKYDLGKVPLKHRWSLDYTRRPQKEKELYDVIKDYALDKYGSEEYAIVQNYTEHPGFQGVVPTYKPKNPINFSYIRGYEITDWLKVLEKASEIVCVDSCLSHYIEITPSLKSVKKIYLGTEEPHYHPFMRNILFNNWINLSRSEISDTIVEDLEPL
jgi:hypothetical protein